MPSKPFLVFWYILSAYAFGTQRNILHHWASAQIRPSKMLNDMTIDKKKYQKPFAQARYTRKRKSQAAAKQKTTNYFVHLKGDPQEKPTKHPQKGTATESQPSL
jgi:hypothetical protein